MKTIHICGDSFGVQDELYGSSWVDNLIKLSDNNFKVVNLSRVCASNTQIVLQVDYAIKSKSHFIICLMTSSTRFDVKFRSQKKIELIDRYTNITDPHILSDLTSYSSNSLDSTTLFDKHQLDLLKKYHREFLDLPLLIYQNELIIEGILSKLTYSKVNFCYDQGGFEHKNFAKANDKIYFQQYLVNKSNINLWDYVESIQHRPYYHIQDASVHSLVADYYYSKIMKVFNEI